MVTEPRRPRIGTEGLTVAAYHRPHIALIDIGLPGLDGIYVARQLRTRVREALLVAVTGRGDNATFEQRMAAGFDRYYLKPLDLDAISNLLDEWKANSGCAA